MRSFDILIGVAMASVAFVAGSRWSAPVPVVVEYERRATELSVTIPDHSHVRPDATALDTLRCHLVRTAERTCNGKRTRTGRIATKCIPYKTGWKGWPKDWNRCKVCGDGPKCNL